LGRCRSSAVRAGARSSDIGSENRKNLRFEKPLLSAGGISCHSMKAVVANNRASEVRYPHATAVAEGAIIMAMMAATRRRPGPMSDEDATGTAGPSQRSKGRPGDLGGRREGSGQRHRIRTGASAGLSNKVATSVLRSHRTDAYVHRHRRAAWRRLRRLRERASTLPWAHAYHFVCRS